MRSFVLYEASQQIIIHPASRTATSLERIVCNENEKRPCECTLAKPREIKLSSGADIAFAPAPQQNRPHFKEPMLHRKLSSR